ncbi:hypothetical protein HPB50_006996 [Hyalomma asiaticum]|uniref:Uncharacterized protein n=1 Tax=Hyalomma asiaticum TaxID=266040 RepID=A0ACB7S845_HYAAI|nr:hypothetical protein HPB50_006996 [Hyalomma asiaticum]
METTPWTRASVHCHQSRLTGLLFQARQSALPPGAAGPRDDGRQRNTVYYRRQVSPKTLHAERVSQPRYTVLIRHLDKVHVTDIPKRALTDAIAQSAPSAFIAEMAILPFDTTSNCIRITLRDMGHFRKPCRLSRLVGTVNGNLHVV